MVCLRHPRSLLPSNIGLFSNKRICDSLTEALGLLPSNIGLFSNPVSVSAHKQRAPGPFCGAKLFLSILPLFLPVVNLNEHPKKPLVISFRRKMRLFIRFESYELQFLIDFSKVPGTFTVVFRCKVHLILLSPPHQHHIPYIFCHSSFL